MAQNQTLPYQASFEAAEGFAKGSIDGQKRWRVLRGEAVINENQGRENSAGLTLTPSSPFGIVQLSIDAGLNNPHGPDDSVVHTDFYVRPGAADAEEGDQFADVEGSLTGFFKIDDQGDFYIYNGGDPENGVVGEWLATGTRIELDEDGQAKNWIRHSFRQDYAAGLWDIAINGHIFRANLHMAKKSQSLEK